MKSILRIEDGKIYRSAKEAAHDTGVTPGMIVHVLKGRSKSAGGYKFSYSDKKFPSRSGKIGTTRKGRPVYDCEGRQYPSLTRIALAKGIPVWKAQHLINRDGVIRHEALRNVPRARIHTASDQGGWYVNDYWFPTRHEAALYAKSIVPHLHPERIYFALARDSAALYHGGKGWFLDVSGDLFAPIKEDER